MDADLDTLVTALYVKTDDLLKACPQWAPPRPAVGIVPELSDAELVTLAVLQALLGFISEARWLRHARAHLGVMFSYLPQQSGYNKRLRKAVGMICAVLAALACDTTLWSRRRVGHRLHPGGVRRLPGGRVPLRSGRM